MSGKSDCKATRRAVTHSFCHLVHAKFVSLQQQAGSGDLEGAIGRYLQCRLPEEIAANLTNTSFIEEFYDRLADPQYKSIVEESVWFCWQFARPNFSPTPDRKQFMRSYVAGRIPTAALLDEAWQACQEAERDALRAGVLSQVTEQEQSAPDLDSLSDEEIGYLYHDTLRRVAEEARYGSNE